MVSQSRPSFSVRISSPCSLNSGDLPGGRRRLVELHRRAHQLERVPSSLDLLQVAVGDDLRVVADLDRVLHDRPLALHAGAAVPCISASVYCLISARDELGADRRRSP